MSTSEQIKYGKKLLSKGELNSAANVFEEIIIKDELNYKALNYLGIIYSMQKEYEKAIEILQKAIDSNSENSNAYLNLAIILFQNGNEKEALQYYRKTIEYDSENTTAYYNYALALEELGIYAEAITNYKKAIEKNENNYTAHHNLGLLNLLLGHYTEGWDGYEYRELAEAVKKRQLPDDKWNGEIIKNKILYVYSDQGFGDTIQFVRFLPEIKKRVGKLIFECHPSLFSLLKNVSGFDEIVEVDASLEPVRDYDYFLPITSIGKILDLNEDNPVWGDPYILANKKSNRNWSDYFKNISAKKIGIVWRSNSSYKYRNRRAIPLASLSAIFGADNCKFFSLQMEPNVEELQILNANNVKNLSLDINNFNDTANIIEQLDLIISSDTAVPHLAGAMGKEVWLLLSNQPAWQWQLGKNNSVWYPTMKLFRQKENWDDIVDDVSLKLKGNINMEIFDEKGLERFKKFLYKVKDETYPEAPLEFHTQISDIVISEIIDKIPFPEKAKILDIGCGQGLGLKKFTEYGFNPVGITLNKTDYEICKKQGYEVYQMDQSFLQFEDETFDFLWARHVLEHSIFPYYTLYEYNRVLKKQGWLYVEVPAAGFDAVHENNPNHYSVLTKTMWRSLFNKAGFDSLYELDFDLVLEKNGKDQYWMFILKKRNEEKDAE